MSDPSITITEVEASAANTTPGFLQKLKANAVYIVLGAWFAVGIAAAVMSIVWFGFGGSLSEKAAGLTLAFVLGPLYFALYFLKRDLCQSMGSQVVGLVKKMRGGSVSTAVAPTVTFADAA